MIITISERQHLKNNYVCSFCEDENSPVVGRAYRHEKKTWPTKFYLFSYCAACGLRQAEKIIELLK